MKIAIVGSRTLDFPIPEFLDTDGVSMIYTGGARGIDRRVRDFAKERGITVTEILPEYNLYRRRAPLIRNDIIISLSDKIYVFWDGKSRGTEYVIRKCRQQNKPFSVYIWKGDCFAEAEKD